MDFITGASGYLGTYLLNTLVEQKRHIVNIPHQEITSYKLDYFNQFFFLSTYGNLFFHDDSNKIIKANVLDLITVIKQAVKFDFKSFVFISTSSVKLPIQTMYSRAKKMAEELLLAYMEKYKVPICIIRPYSILGVGEHKEHLVPTLIRSCMTGELVNFVPEPCHDFIDVEDVVSGILSLSGNSAKGIFELGSGKQYSNQEILEIVEKTTGKKANLNIIDQIRPYDTLNWVSSNFRARSFGWLPKKSVEQSIKEMVEDYIRTN